MKSFILLALVLSFNIFAQEQEIENNIISSEQRVNDVVEKFANGLYFKDKSSRDILKQQAKSKILDMIADIPQEHEQRTHLYELLLEQKKKAVEVAKIANASYAKLQFCQEMLGEEVKEISPTVKRLVEEKEIAWVEDLDQLMQMYTYAIVEEGAALDRMIQYQFETSKCSESLKAKLKKSENDKCDVNFIESDKVDTKSISKAE